MGGEESYYSSYYSSNSYGNLSSIIYFLCSILPKPPKKNCGDSFPSPISDGIQVRMTSKS